MSSLLDQTGKSPLRPGVAAVTGVFLILLSGCSGSRSENPTATPTLAPVPSQTPNTAPSPTPSLAKSSVVKSAVHPAIKSGPVIARLADFEPRVTFRRKNELVWQESEKALPLFQSDAVKTHANASARLEFVNRSVLELAENTLVIVSLPSAKKAIHGDDRAILRHGKLNGVTQNELWLLTSNALFHMKAESAEKKAIASLSIHDGKKLQIELKQGSGAVLQKKPSGKEEQITLTPHQAITLESAGSPESADSSADSNDEPADAQLDKWIQRFHAAQPTQKTDAHQTQADVFIESPANRAELRNSTAVFRGKTNIKNVELLINGQKAKIEADLSFAIPVPLRPGPNSISIQLIQPDGSSTFRRWLLFRKE